MTWTIQRSRLGFNAEAGPVWPRTNRPRTLPRRLFEG